MADNLTLIKKDKKTGISDIVHKNRKIENYIESLTKCIDLKDPKLAKHCRAVVNYSEYIAKELGNVSINQIKKLKDAAMLHDIGKIMVDSAILNKKERLSDREYLQVKGHSERGMRILSYFSANDIMTDVAWHHHERWDGGGYPDGLKGDEIDYLTQIVTVADAIDAMAENRPYRMHLSDLEIIKQLELEKGKQFNPEVAEAAIQVIKNQMGIANAT